MNSLGFTAFVRGLGVALTPGQRALCLVAFDGLEPRDLEGEERELARVIFGDVETIPPEARGVLVAVCGARAGKSYVLAALRLLHLALIVPLDALAPGERGAGLIVAPDLRLARQTLRYIKGAIDRSVIARLRMAETTDSITLKRAEYKPERYVTIECLPATRGGSAVRGRSLVGAALDEAAFFRDDNFVVNDVEVYRAVVVRVMRHGQLIVASTPWAEAGLLHDEFQANWGKPSRALAAHAPTLLLNPSKRVEVERERSRDPETARREFDAEFMPAGSGAFFSPAAIAKAVDDELELPAGIIQGARIAVGGDFGFRSDSSALVVVQRERDLYIVSDVVEMVPRKGAPLQPSTVIDMFAKAAKRYGATTIGVDIHYVESVREHLKTSKLGLYEAPGGANGKAVTYQTARALLHEGKVKLPKHARLLRQLREVISKPTPGGGLTISSPRWQDGGHGDLVSAFVLALWMARHGYSGKARMGRASETVRQLRGEGGDDFLDDYRYVNGDVRRVARRASSPLRGGF